MDWTVARVLIYSLVLDYGFKRYKLRLFTFPEKREGKHSLIKKRFFSIHYFSFTDNFWSLFEVRF
ncbi:hypothetical protein HCUR_01367 [Holospora curviuscula]|uniref:Uncharacterized protein n=1 Tax=Holospora curviuscula TaxID=1082868 RepID=A0A2S5R774_9PROT|nr:hypothetical protein HCUR_01367 [Holospora curviuscula]